LYMRTLQRQTGSPTRRDGQVRVLDGVEALVDGAEEDAEQELAVEAVARVLPRVHDVAHAALGAQVVVELA
jgi:hypothetical protein